jgi:molybdopterin synthase catalytic subunit
VSIQVQTEDFDLAAELAALRQADPGAGALVSFVGLVRDLNDGSDVATLTLEYYPGMTERSLAALEQEACTRWPLGSVRIIHRVGTLHPTAQIVLVAVTSAHRNAAFAACEFIMDTLKTTAPFWKREVRPDGEHWVDARESDQAAAARWQLPV